MRTHDIEVTTGEVDMNRAVAQRVGNRQSDLKYRRVMRGHEKQVIAEIIGLVYLRIFNSLGVSFPEACFA